jgi:hypothetical protein
MIRGTAQRHPFMRSVAVGTPVPHAVVDQSDAVTL